MKYLSSLRPFARWNIFLCMLYIVKKQKNFNLFQILLFYFFLFVLLFFFFLWYALYFCLCSLATIRLFLTLFQHSICLYLHTHTQINTWCTVYSYRKVQCIIKLLFSQPSCLPSTSFSTRTNLYTLYYPKVFHFEKFLNYGFQNFQKPPTTHAQSKNIYHRTKKNKIIAEELAICIEIKLKNKNQKKI